MSFPTERTLPLFKETTSRPNNLSRKPQRQKEVAPEQ
jgi:hypothetical protein